MAIYDVKFEGQVYNDYPDTRSYLVNYWLQNDAANVVSTAGAQRIPLVLLGKETKTWPPQTLVFDDARERRGQWKARVWLFNDRGDSIDYPVDIVLPALQGAL